MRLAGGRRDSAEAPAGGAPGLPPDSMHAGREPRPQCSLGGSPGLPVFRRSASGAGRAFRQGIVPQRKRPRGRKPCGKRLEAPRRAQLGIGGLLLFKIFDSAVWFRREGVEGARGVRPRRKLPGPGQTLHVGPAPALTVAFDPEMILINLN